MGEFVPFSRIKHKQQFIELNVEFLNWTVEVIKARYGVDIVAIMGGTAREYVEASYEEVARSFERDGIFYILEVAGEAMGMGGVRKLEEGICEIKRMYIRPECRGQGLGKELVRKLLEHAGSVGFSLVRLESGVYMESAHHIYRSLGFKEREPYDGYETPEPFKPFAIFMELEL
ncbi:MAG: GNAT family N-acetyltransferase [Candidatus Thorarchaeota archaeon]|nr:MAG: GNAT family N-acetyltransferase [Candidatus Thorarchaeota archaeon]